MASSHPLVLDLGPVVGPRGAPGEAGAPGPAGASFLSGSGAPGSGSGAPGSGAGADGDTYLDALSLVLYVRAGGEWTPSAEQPFAPRAFDLKDPDATGVVLREGDTAEFFADESSQLLATKRGGVVTLTCRKPDEASGTYFYHSLTGYDYDSHDFGIVLPAGLRPSQLVYGFSLATDADDKAYMGQVQVEKRGSFGVPRFYGTDGSGPASTLTLKSLRFSVSFVAAEGADDADDGEEEAPA